MSEDIKRTKNHHNQYYEIIPKKEILEKKFWYVNAGLLSGSNYDRAVIFVATTKLSKNDLEFVLFLGVKYLIHYIELYTFDPTSLLIFCIEKQLKYLQALLGKQKKSHKLLNYFYIIKTQKTFEKLILTDFDNRICRQMYIEHLEKLCLLFASRIHIWQKNPHLQAYLFRYNFDPYRSAAIYNTFTIPSQNNYVDPLLRMDQKFLEKIETKCHCKILLANENMDCHLTPEFVCLEVIFDLYKGNYVGFLDMFNQVVKQLNSTLYFAKSLRTVLIEGSLLYNVLTNVPVRNLKYLEKNIIAGLPVSPFLDASSTGKQLYSILALIKRKEEKSKPDENSDKSEKEISKKETEIDSLSLDYYDQHVEAKEWIYLKLCVNKVNISQILLDSFLERYEKKKISCPVNVIEKKDFSYAKVYPTAMHLKKENQKEKKDYESSVTVKINDEENSNNKPEFDNQHESSLEDKKECKISKDSVLSSLNQKDKDPSNNEILKNILLSKVSNPNNCAELNSVSNPTLQDQFELILQQGFNEYTSEIPWINHKMRLMMRCNTKETADDLKNPYIFERLTIKERINKKTFCRNKFAKIEVSKHPHKNIIRELEPTASRVSIRASWLSKEASLILTEGMQTENDVSETDTVLASFTDEDESTLPILSPDITEYLKGYNEKLKRQIMVNNLLSRTEWLKFFERRIIINQPLFDIENEKSKISDIFTEVKETVKNILMRFDNNSDKNIYTLVHFLTGGELSYKLFLCLLEGQGTNFAIFDKINIASSSHPLNLGKSIKTLLVGASNYLYQLIYDLNLLSLHANQDLVNVLSFHIFELKRFLKHSSEDIKITFETLEIINKLEAVKSARRAKLRDLSYQHNELRLASELIILYEILVGKSCGSLPSNKQIGIRILYHSMQIEYRLNVVEPFLRLPDDKRLKDIEKECHCCITLRIHKHPFITTDECIVDIVYDFEKGDHFQVIDLMKSMMGFQHKLMTTQNHRTLIMFPSGELWVFRDFEWIRTILNT